MSSPVRTIDVHAAYGDDPVRDAAHGGYHPTRIGFGHRAHVYDGVWIEQAECFAMIEDSRAIAVDMSHRCREICLVLSTMEHRDLVVALDQLPHDAWPNEDRSPNDENATHGPIVRVRESLSAVAPRAEHPRSS